MADTTTAQARQIGYTPAQLNARVEMATAAKDRRIAELEAQVAQYKQDAELLDYLQRTGSTIELLPGSPYEFRVGGLYKTANADLRVAIRAAITAGASHE